VDLSVHEVTSYEDLQVWFQKSSYLRWHSTYFWGIQHVGLQAKFDPPMPWCNLPKIFGKRNLII
jgi:hypothetical protein